MLVPSSSLLQRIQGPGSVFKSSSVVVKAIWGGGGGAGNPPPPSPKLGAAQRHARDHCRDQKAKFGRVCDSRVVLKEVQPPTFHPMISQITSLLYMVSGPQSLQRQCKVPWVPRYPEAEERPMPRRRYFSSRFPVMPGKRLARLAASEERLWRQEMISSPDHHQAGIGLHRTVRPARALLLLKRAAQRTVWHPIGTQYGTPSPGERRAFPAKAR